MSPLNLTVIFFLIGLAQSVKSQLAKKHHLPVFLLLFAFGKDSLVALSKGGQTETHIGSFASQTLCSTTSL